MAADAMRDAQMVADALGAPAQTTTTDIVLFNLCKGMLLFMLASETSKRLERAMNEGLLPVARQSKAERLMALSEEGEPEPQPTMVQRWMKAFVDRFVTPMVQALTRPAPGPDLSHLGRVPVPCVNKLVELCGDPPPVLSKCVLCVHRHRKAMKEVCGDDLGPVCGA